MTTQYDLFIQDIIDSLEDIFYGQRTWRQRRIDRIKARHCNSGYLAWVNST